MEQIISYNKAPLVELIIEIQWSVATIGIAGAPPIVAGQSTALDLWFPSLTERLRTQGFHNLERMVPHEMFAMAHQPIYRYSKDGARFPIIQFGHGVFTINTGPPNYHSWVAFRSQVEQAMTALVDTKSNDEPAAFSRIMLRYINRFDAELRAGLSNYAFIRDDLGVTIGMPPGLIDLASNPNRINPTLAISFPVHGKDNANMTFQITAARLGDSQETDTILDMAYAIDGDMPVMTDAILDRLQEAYAVIHSWFENLTINIRARMDPVLMD